VALHRRLKEEISTGILIRLMTGSVSLPLGIRIFDRKDVKYRGPIWQVAVCEQ